MTQQTQTYDFERVEKWFRECGGGGGGGKSLGNAMKEAQDGLDQASDINPEDRIDYSGRAMETIEEFFTEIKRTDEDEKRRTEEESQRRYREATAEAARRQAEAQKFLYTQGFTGTTTGTGGYGFTGTGGYGFSGSGTSATSYTQGYAQQLYQNQFNGYNTIELKNAEYKVEQGAKTTKMLKNPPEEAKQGFFQKLLGK